MDADVKKQLQEKVQATVDHLKVDLAAIRTGRASLAMFESIPVNYYGTITPLKQLANLSTPESRTVMIQPWDISQISEIEKAILSSNLGLTPSNDGKMIRLSIPMLTEEKRKELVKLVKKRGEECKVTIRNIRRDINDILKGLQKTAGLSEDVLRANQEEAQKITDQTIVTVDGIMKKKEEEVLQV